MNNFRTELNISTYDFKITYDKKLFFVGSCFSENISNLFKEYKFNVFSNPSGILYNPISISDTLNFIIDTKIFNKEDLFYHNNKWLSLYHHGNFSDTDLETLLKKINLTILDANRFLKESDFLFITFGSAFVYELKENKLIVANCHKLNSKLFNQRLLNIDEIKSNYIKLINKLIDFNNKLKIIFTISPIRYLKYGHEQNTYSKSILVISINEIKKHFKNIYYFPSYELILDDLRDYRFYNDDMIHPSNQAIEYVWNKLINSTMDKKTLNQMKTLEKVLLAKKHIPFDSKSQDYREFCIKNIKLIEKLNNENKNFNLEEEKKFFLNFISNL